jgi:hypothetical protein
MAYFSKFPVMQYPVRDGDTFRYALTRNILRRVALTEDIKSGDGVFLKYDVKDGERPEHIAERVYGDPSFHWIILLTNDVIDPYHGWYKSSASMEDYIQSKYGGSSVYIGTTSGGFFYSTELVSGVTIQQGNLSTTVIDYQPELCKLTVRGAQFSEGNAVLGFTSGTFQTVTIYRVDPSFTALHHFEVSRPSGDCGANQTAYVDPLSQQNTSYSVVGGVVGNEDDEYPTTETEGLNYSPSGTVDFWETYIGRYIGVSGDQVNVYSVSNYTYENGVNEAKRSIKVLHPRYKSVALKELESLLRV